jgi:chromosome segregation ATPase
VAFWFALRDTLVASDIAQGTRIAYVGGKAAFRVVTLAGELIDTSGTMSGGGAYYLAFHQIPASSSLYARPLQARCRCAAPWAPPCQWTRLPRRRWQ